MKSTKFSLILLASLANNTLAKGGDSITLAWENGPRSFDPRYSVDANSQYLEDLIHCSLLTFDSDGAVKPGLAKSYNWGAPTKLDLELRQDMKFTNGKPVTAQDVIATYRSLVDPHTKPVSPRSGAFRHMKSVTSKNKNSITFELNQPDATFVTNLTIGILPQPFLAQEAKTETELPPTCGAFQLAKTTTNQLDLTSNPHIPADLKPRSKVTIKFVKDESTRFAKLVTGEVDIVQNSLNFSKLSEISRKYPHLEIQKKPGLKTSYIGINMRDPILKKQKVRKALAHAIDKDEIIKYILGGLAIKAKTLLPPSDPLFKKDLNTPEFSKDRADALLTEAGYPRREDGKPRLTLSYKTTQNATRIAIAKALGSQLKKLEVKLKVEALEWGRFKEDVEKGRVQLWGLTWVGFKDPDIYRYAFSTESFPPNGGNRGWYSNPELDKLLVEARITTDATNRQKLYKEIQLQVAEDLPYIFLWHEENYAVYPKTLKGFELYADGRYSSLRKVWKK